MSEIYAGLCRTDGSESMVAGAVCNQVGKKVQRERLLQLYTDHGPKTDQEIEQMFQSVFGCEIRADSIHARRNELINDGLVDWTGAKSPSPFSNIPTMKWGLVTQISAAQMRKNLERRMGPRFAIKFALRVSRADDDTTAMDFLRAWADHDWDRILQVWPDFMDMRT